MEIYKLHPNTTYKFRVWAINKLGPGDYAEVMATTKDTLDNQGINQLCTHLSRRREPPQNNTPPRLFVSPFKFMGVWHRPMGVSSQALGSSPCQCWSVRSDSPSSSWLSLCFKIGEFVREVSAWPLQPWTLLMWGHAHIYYLCVLICFV